MNVIAINMLVYLGFVILGIGASMMPPGTNPLWSVPVCVFIAMPGLLTGILIGLRFFGT